MKDNTLAKKLNVSRTTIRTALVELENKGIIAAEQDTRTYESGKILFATTTNASSKFIIYKAGDHGYPLLDKDAHLASSIVNWLDSQLTN